MAILRTFVGLITQLFWGFFVFQFYAHRSCSTQTLQFYCRPSFSLLWTCSSSFFIIVSRLLNANLMFRPKQYIIANMCGVFIFKSILLLWTIKKYIQCVGWVNVNMVPKCQYARRTKEREHLFCQKKNKKTKTFIYTNIFQNSL